jgi:hypothetical protein
MKEFESGEEFVFDGFKQLPVIGALYAIPRFVVYFVVGNKNQVKASVHGLAHNGFRTVRLIASPAVATLSIAKWATR